MVKSDHGNDASDYTTSSPETSYRDEDAFGKSSTAALEAFGFDPFEVIQEHKKELVTDGGFNSGPPKAQDRFNGYDTKIPDDLSDISEEVDDSGEADDYDLSAEDVDVPVWDMFEVSQNPLESEDRELDQSDGTDSYGPTTMY